LDLRRKRQQENGNDLVKSLLNALLIKVYSDNQIRKNEMGGACSTYWEGKLLVGFWWENVRNETTWKI
jgi:hypothetical protein